MPIDHHDQLEMIKDILHNQKTDCCATVAEYQQIQRLIQSLLGNENIQETNKKTLYDIYSYTQPGVNGKNLEQHIEQHDQQLEQWINVLDTHTLQDTTN